MIKIIIELITKKEYLDKILKINEELLEKDLEY